MAFNSDNKKENEKRSACLQASSGFEFGELFIGSRAATNLCNLLKVPCISGWIISRWNSRIKTIHVIHSVTVLKIDIEQYSIIFIKHSSSIVTLNLDCISKREHILVKISLFVSLFFNRKKFSDLILYWIRLRWNSVRLRHGELIFFRIQIELTKSTKLTFIEIDDLRKIVPKN